MFIGSLDNIEEEKCDDGEGESELDERKTGVNRRVEGDAEEKFRVEDNCLGRYGCRTLIVGLRIINW